MGIMVRAACALTSTGLVVLGISGCCTTTTCLEKRSTPDRARVAATAVKVGVVHNDTVSSPQRDRTDWKYVDLPVAGKLSVQLHWDNGKAKLTLSVYDKLGLPIQDGRPWGAGGLRALIVVEEPGRHYIRVRAHHKRDESHYALRLTFEPEGGNCPCHDCSVGEQRCLGRDAYIVCDKVNDECSAWARVFSCGPGSPCRNGRCAGCGRECEEGSKRCSSASGYQVCARARSGCLSWSAAKRCTGNKRCRGGDCVRRRGTRTITPQPQPKRGLKARIISIYTYRGRMTLHIEIGDSKDIKPGMTGYVLDGSTGKKLSGGDIKISRVSGRYAIATTSLEKLGKNRWVRIKLR